MTNEELTELREAFNAYTASEGCGCCGNEKRHDAARERMNAILWPKQPSQETCPGEHEDPDFKREDGTCTICSP